MTNVIVRERLHRQALTGPRHDTGGEVVRALVAVQAQEHAIARWSIGMRMRGADDAGVERALSDGAILRTHVLRPTWHFVLPGDIRWLLELTAPRVRRMTASYERRLGLTEAIFARTSAVIERALGDGAHLTRTELARVLKRARLPAAGTALGHVMMRAELDALICSGAPRGKQHTYALLADRAPHARRLDGEEALAELTLRFFEGHGPATLRDFRWWSSLTAGAVTSALELVRGRLNTLDVDGLTYWFAGDAAPAPIDSPSVHLLQAYDEYVVAYAESKRVLQADAAAPRLPGGMRPLLHVIIRDGRHGGFWQRTVKKKDLVLDVQLFGKADRTIRRAMDAAVERYGRYMRLEPVWRRVER